MARGYPDWGVLAQLVGSADVDMAELAVRLGSMYRFTRTGKVVFQDDFVTDLNNYQRTLGAGTSTLEVSPQFGYEQPGCALWRCSVNPSNASVTLSTSVPPLLNSRYGIECLVSSFNEDIVYDLAIITTNNLKILTFGLRLNYAANSLSVRGEDNAFTVLSTRPLYPDNGRAWTLLKMVVDVSKEVYGYIRKDDLLFTIPTVVPDSDVSGAEDYAIQLKHTVSSGSATGDMFAIAYHVLTMDEP